MDLSVPFWIKSIVFSMTISKFISQCRRIWPDIEFVIHKQGQDIWKKLFIIVFNQQDIYQVANLGYFPEIVNQTTQEIIIQKIKEFKNGKTRINNH